MATTELPVVQTDAATASQSAGYDLLQIRPLKAVTCWGGFPYVFQAALLAAFVGLAVLGWGLYPPDGVQDKLYAKSNLVNLLIWGLWWPAMVWAAVVIGRAWCAVCPLELVANITERTSRRLGVKQRALGQWLAAGWLMVALYAVIQLLVTGIHLHRVPAYTSVFLWGMLGTAGVVGILFKDRAYCRGYCPVGMLLGTFGRGAVLAVRAVSADRCADCGEKHCRKSANRTKLDARSCPSLLNPARLDQNADCLFCGQCIKVCQPGNMGLLLRGLFPATDAREASASWPVTLFVMLVSGFVASELFSEWKAAQAYYLWLPEHVSQWLHAGAYAGSIEGVWTLVIVPLVLWLVLGSIVLLLRGTNSMTDAWRRLALSLLIVIAFGQMAKGLAKFVSWVGFLPLAARDPQGVHTALALAGKTLPQPAAILPMLTVSLISIVLILMASRFALRELRLTQGAMHRPYAVPVLCVAACCLTIVFGWGFLQ